MGITYNLASSILLCAEDNNSILCFGDEERESQNLGLIREQKFGFYWDFLSFFPLQTEDCVALLVERETHHLPSENYVERLQNGAFETSFRRDAIDWIWKVHSHYNFGPQTLYLSVNYLDRFLSTYVLPQDKAWMGQLLSVACLSLAVKMEETLVPLSLDLQICEAKYVFEAKTIQRMELLVLSTLKWRMQAVTPFSFIDYFVNKFSEIKSPSNLLMSRCIELILIVVQRIEFVQFRPSEISAAVTLSILSEIEDIDIIKSLNSSTQVKKERVRRCYGMIREMELVDKRVNGSGDTSQLAHSVPLSVPQSPIGVLDAACLSYKSDDSFIKVESHATGDSIPIPSSPLAKRRKPC